MTHLTIQSSLEALGSDPAAIAAALQERGITGRPISDRHCPIAHYLHDQAPAYQWSVVSHNAIGYSRTYERVEIVFPPAVTAFIHAFDREDYPALIAPVREGVIA